MQNTNLSPGQSAGVVAHPVSSFDPPPNGTPGSTNPTNPPAWSVDNALVTVHDVASDGFSAVVTAGSTPGVATVTTEGVKPDGTHFITPQTFTVGLLPAIGFIFTITLL